MTPTPDSGPPPPLPVATPVPVPTPTPRPVFTLTLDNFESGIVLGNDGYWRSPWTLEGNAHVFPGFLSKGAPASGSVHLILQENGARARRSVDLSRESSVRLQFWAKADSFETRDSAEVLVCAGECGDHGDWTLLKRFVDREDDNTYRLYDLRVPDRLLTGEFVVEFRSAMSDDSDWFFADDVAFVSTDPGPTPTPTATPIPTPTRTPKPTKKPTRVPTPVPVTINVSLTDGLRFQPASISVKAGASVTFVVTNTDQFRNHTFTVVPSQTQKSPELVDTGQLASAGSASRTKKFSIGEYYYYCTVPGHEALGMKGNLMVTK